MQARLLAYVPEGAAIVRIVAPGDRLRIGRSPDADLLLSHASVSRRHAELATEPDGLWRLTDLDSKNGTFVDGARVASTPLAQRGARRAVAPHRPRQQERTFVDGARVASTPLAQRGWLRFGDVHCDFALLDEQAADEQARRWQERRAQATRLTARVDALAHPRDREPNAPALLDHSLRAVLELAQCTRGFVLIAEAGRYRVATSIALDASLATGPQFTGSLGAVAHALRSHAPVVFNDVAQDARLPTRDSIVRSGLRTLVALPLFDGTRALGAIYADRREAGPPLTTLDVELLQAFAEHCTRWLAAHREAHPALDPPSTGDWSHLLAAHGPAR